MESSWRSVGEQLEISWRAVGEQLKQQNLEVLEIELVNSWTEIPGILDLEYWR